MNIQQYFNLVTKYFFKEKVFSLYKNNKKDCKLTVEFICFQKKQWMDQDKPLFTLGYVCLNKVRTFFVNPVI